MCSKSLRTAPPVLRRAGKALALNNRHSACRTERRQRHSPAFGLGLMASFDFMTDEDLRASLEDDVRQMNVCLDAGAYKAAQVLAGSIVEALLTDFLTGIAYKPKAKSILEMTLGELVVAARSEKVVSAMTGELASVVKEYRNLIHPGRAKRLAQTADAHTARIAKDVVEIIIGDVAKRKVTTYGYTAKQIAAKVESDPSSGVIIADLIRDAPPPELERLLVQTIPDRYLLLSSTETASDADALPGLRRTFHAAMDVAPEALRRRVMERYVKVLKEQPEFEVLRYEEAFFRAVDLPLLPRSDAETAKAHLLDQVSRDFGPRLEPPLTSFGTVATAAELRQAAESVVRWAAGMITTERRELAERVLRDLWISAPLGSKPLVPEALKSWERGTGPAEWMKWLAATRRSMGDPSVVRLAVDDTDLDDLPF